MHSKLTDVINIIKAVVALRKPLGAWIRDGNTVCITLLQLVGTETNCTVPLLQAMLDQLNCPLESDVQVSVLQEIDKVLDGCQLVNLCSRSL